jgi:hypothetical protein
MQTRPLLALAALAAAAEPDLGRSALESLKARYDDDPIPTTVATVLVAALLFYRAERGHNPKVTSYYDALVYVSTSLSVGYSDIFAKTTAGKTIGSALMTVGPAMAANLFEKDKDRAVVERLDKILAALGGATSPASSA